MIATDEKEIHLGLTPATTWHLTLKEAANRLIRLDAE